MYAGGSDGLACRRLAYMGPDDGVSAVIVGVVNGTGVIGSDASEVDYAGDASVCGR